MKRILTQMFPNAKQLDVLDCQSITGGYSRIMQRVSASIDGQTHRYVVRSDPPEGQSPVETSRDNEWALVEAMTQAGAPIPKALHYDARGSAFGRKAMIVEYIEGTSLLTAARNSQSGLAHPARTLCEMAAGIHNLDTKNMPSHLELPLCWDAYIADCIEAWRTTEAEHPDSLPLFRYVATWLERNKPAPAPLTLVHGEFQPSNIMAGTATQSPVVVDWEFAHIGDPREDLGWAKFMGATVQPPDLIGYDEEAFCERYRELTEMDREVINPQTIAYFMILPMGRQIRPLLNSVSMFERGEVDSLAAAYMGLSFLSTAQTTWLSVIKSLSMLTKQ